MLGQEQDGTFLFTWVESKPNCKSQSHIGLYEYSSNTLKRIYSFDKTINTIQASISSSGNVLGLVTKCSTINEETKEETFTYEPCFVKLNDEKKQLCRLGIERSKQIMIQFLYKKHSVLSEEQSEKVLILLHEECKKLYMNNPNYYFNFFIFRCNSIST